MFFLYFTFALMACSLIFSFYCIAKILNIRKYDQMLYPICQDRRVAYKVLFEKRTDLSDKDYKGFISAIDGMNGFIHEYNHLLSKNLINIKVFLASLVKTVRLGEKISLKVEHSTIEDDDLNNVLKDFSMHFICCFFRHTSLKMIVVLTTTGLVARLHRHLNIGTGKTVERSDALLKFREKYKNFDCTNEQCTVS